MFKENKDYLQTNLFSFENQLSKEKAEKLRKSEEYYFFKMIFSKIKEDDFAVLYSEKCSRPNAAVNQLVSALILMNRKGWTYEELFNRIDFDLLTRSALGLFTIEEAPFCQATIFNFQNLLADHYIRTGENLLERVFDGLTEKQLKALKLKTNIQRSDSFLAASNIRNYSRLQLLIEVLIRLHRILTKKEKKKYSDKFAPYIKQSSGQYIYHLKGSDLNSEIEKIGEVYHWLYKKLEKKYSGVEIFQTFERVYTEHFTVADKKVEVIAAEELTSSIVQSPDDVEATYRRKRTKESRGQSINITETANPENPVSLLTDVSVNPNNKDDSKVLNKRLDVMKEKTPDLEELHTDGAYGSEDNDEKMEELDILHVPTGIRGREGKVEIKIEKKRKERYNVSCPGQKVKAKKARKKFRANFDLKKCSSCSLKEICPTIELKNSRAYYFTKADYMQKNRQQNINKIPRARRKLRPNVESTVNEFTCKTKKGKLKVRGAFKAEIFAFTMALSINFGRIYRLILENPEEYAALLRYLLYFFVRKVKLLNSNNSGPLRWYIFQYFSKMTEYALKSACF